MKQEQLVESRVDYIPRDREHNTAGSIARQIVRAARYKGGAKPKQARDIAHKMASRFHSDVLQAIDAELDYDQLKSVDGYA